MPPDPLVVTIARVDISQKVALTSHLPLRATILVGQPLHVNVTYKLKESSLNKEAYRFRMSSRIGPQRPSDLEKTWHDRPVLHDELQGFIGHRYVFDAPGVYTGEAVVMGQ